MESDEIPTVETYRGVGIHDCQSQHRIDHVVKPEIDSVMETADLDRLLEWARDITKSPESRLLAAAKLRAAHEIATAERRVRPEIDLDLVKACVAGLNLRRRRDRRYFCSIFDMAIAPGAPRPVPRDEPLSDRSSA